MDLQRHHPGRQAVGRRRVGPRPAAQRFNHLASGVVVNQDAGIAPPGLGVGPEHDPQPGTEVGGRGIGEAHRTARTHRGAGAATHAQVRLDPDMITVGRDRARRADVDAFAASRLCGAAVSAGLGVIVEILRLLEFTDHAHQLGRGRRLRQRIGARREIALRRLVLAQHRPRRQIEHQVKAFAAHGCHAREIDRTHIATGAHAGTMRGTLVEVDLVREIDRLLRASLDTGIAARTRFEIDRIGLMPLHLERTEPTRDRCSGTGDHREIALCRQLRTAGPFGHQHADIERAAQAFGPRQSAARVAENQGGTLRAIAHAAERHGFGQLRGREQCRDFRRRARGFGRPAAGFANVDKAQRHILVHGARREFRKQRGFLRTGDGQRIHLAGRLGERRLECRKFTPAQFVVNWNRSIGAQRQGERLAVERHGVVAVAYEAAGHGRDSVERIGGAD